MRLILIKLKPRRRATALAYNFQIKENALTIISHNTTNPATDTPIPVLYSEYEDALSAMAIADEMALDLKQRSQAEQERDQQADRANYAVYRILIRRAENAAEKQIQKDLLREYASEIINAEKCSRLHGLHLKMPLLAIAA